MKLSELARTDLAKAGFLQAFAYGAFLDPDVRIVRRAGSNLDVDTATAPEDLWAGSGLYPGFPDAAEQVRISSSSANDTAAGTGARTVFVSGLDISGNFISETLTLNGTTPVVSTNSYWRLNRAYVTTSGNSNKNFNEGIITIQQNVTTSVVFAIISAGFGESKLTAYTIPTGTTGLLFEFEADGFRSTNTFSGTVGLYTRQPNVAPDIVELVTLSTSQRGIRTINGGIFLPAGTDVILRVMDVTANDISINGAFQILVIRN